MGKCGTEQTLRLSDGTSRWRVLPKKHNQQVEGLDPGNLTAAVTDSWLPALLGTAEHHLHCVPAESLQSCPSPGTPWTAARQAPLSMGILQATVLEWVVMPSSGGSSQPTHCTQVSHVAGRFFSVWAPGKPRGTSVFNIWNNCQVVAQSGCGVLLFRLQSMSVPVSFL